MERKYGLNFRLINEKDAEFMVGLRAIEKLSRFLPPTSSDVSRQVEWIRNYKQREKAGLEYYYIFEDDLNNKLGLSRIYAIHALDFTVGGWIFRPDALLGSAILGDIIVREIGFTVLKKTKCLFEVHKGNVHVIRYHMKYNPKNIGEDKENYYFEIDQERFDQGKMIYLKLLQADKTT